MDYQMASNDISPTCKPKYNETWLSMQESGFPFSINRTKVTYQDECAQQELQKQMTFSDRFLEAWPIYRIEGIGNLLVYFFLWLGILELIWRRNANTRH